MGNTIVPGDVPTGLGLVESPGSLLQRFNRTPSIISPLMMVENGTDGGISDPVKKTYPSTPELLKEVKQSEAWKSFMQEFEGMKPTLEKGEIEEENPDEMESIYDKIGKEEIMMKEEQEKYYQAVNVADGSKNSGQEDTKTMKDLLHTLKEKTGYSYRFCKQALEENKNDLEKAEEWLERESKALGLEKMKKIEKRISAEGLVGVAWGDRHAAMVEVNSETDFVSTNPKFHELVDVVANTCLRHAKEKNPSPTTTSQMLLKGDELSSLVADDKQNLSDHLSSMIALVGERLRLRRAALISTEESARVAVLTHPASHDNHGRLGTILVYKSDIYNDQTAVVAKNICQHIIGMNPKSLKSLEGGNKDTALLSQAYLREPSLTVADVAAGAGLEIQHFVRFERGEPGEDPDDLGSEPAKPLC